MTPTYAAQVSMVLKIIDINILKIDGSSFNSYKIANLSFLVKNK